MMKHIQPQPSRSQGEISREMRGGQKPENKPIDTEIQAVLEWESMGGRGQDGEQAGSRRTGDMEGFSEEVNFTKA